MHPSKEMGEGDCALKWAFLLYYNYVCGGFVKTWGGEYYIY